jgi:hypothetical protein
MVKNGGREFAWCGDDVKIATFYINSALFIITVFEVRKGSNKSIVTI